MTIFCRKKKCAYNKNGICNKKDVYISDFRECLNYSFMNKFRTGKKNDR